MQLPASPLQRQFRDGETKPAAHQGLVAPPEKAVADFRQFVLRYARTVVVDDDCKVAPVFPYTANDRSLPWGVQSGVFEKVPSREREQRTADRQSSGEEFGADFDGGGLWMVLPNIGGKVLHGLANLYAGFVAIMFSALGIRQVR